MNLLIIFGFDIHYHPHLILSMCIGGNSVDTHLKKVGVAEFKKLANFVVGVAGDKSKFGFAVVNGYRIGVELVVLLPHECEFGADFQFIEN